MDSYIIGIGGTGARCIEAVIYLSAAGIFTRNVNMLLIDPDVDNGNSNSTIGLINNYIALTGLRQPQSPTKKGWLGSAVYPPQFFRSKVNQDGRSPTRWNAPQRNQGRTFENVLQYDSCPEKLKQFIDLFYTSDDLKMSLEVGYQGRTSVGSVALKQDMEETVGTPGIGLREFLESLVRDLESETKVFVIGSIFGGTGAAGIPTIPALVANLDTRVFPEQNRGNLRWGTALVAPYFLFPPPTDSGNGEEVREGPGTNSVLHPIAAKAALMHYAHTPPDYQHLYLLGAPQRQETNTLNIRGGSQQRNQAHYIEIMTAFAAWDFFNINEEIDPSEKLLHFADSVDKHHDLGVNWETLPVSSVIKEMREDFKQKLVIFTTFAYLYHHILHEQFILNKSFKDSSMYENFVNLDLESAAERRSLEILNNFCSSYLTWLREIGSTAGNTRGGNSILRLFNWEAFGVSDPEVCAERIGNLLVQGTLTQTAHASPRYATEGYSKIMSRLGGIRLQSPDTQSAAGLLIYLLSQAVTSFCKENYRW